MPGRRSGRPEHCLRRTAWVGCPSRRRRRSKLDRLKAAGAERVLARGQRRRWCGIRGHRAEPAVPKRGPGRELERAGSATRTAVAAYLELSAATVDLTRALD